MRVIDNDLLAAHDYEGGHPYEFCGPVLSLDLVGLLYFFVALATIVIDAVEVALRRKVDDAAINGVQNVEISCVFRDGEIFGRG
ncbi:MAG: hypothetical protein QNJ43_09355 [Breoghania sp.]|nr:hypothetical protein [Breoghania sp.]